MNMEEDYDQELGGGDSSTNRWRKAKAPKAEDVFDVEENTPTPSDEDEPEVVGVINNAPRTEEKQQQAMKSLKKNYRTNKNPAEVIDLTNEEEEVNIDQEMESQMDNTSEAPTDIIEKEVQEMDVILDEPEFADLPELVEIEPVSKNMRAEEFRKRGNELYGSHNYNQALDAYNKAIELVPNAVSYYGNRAACFMMLKRFTDAIRDAQTALLLDPKFEKGYVRLVRAHLTLGNLVGCEASIDKMEKELGSSETVKMEKNSLSSLKSMLSEMETYTIRKDYRRVLYLCDRYLSIASGDNNIKIRKAFALLRLSRHIEAGEIASEIMSIDAKHVDAHLVRGLCHYQMENFDKSLSFFKACLQYNPDELQTQQMFKKVKLIKEQRETASVLFQQGKYEESKKVYFECLKLVTEEGLLKNPCIESKLYFNLSLIFNKERSYDESITYASKAVDISSTYYKAFVHRASVYNTKEMYEEAARDYETALKIDPTKRELKQEIQNAKMAAKRSKRKDYYKILDIPKSASEVDIKKAYKKRAMLHHPDRHASATEAVQKEQEKQFKDVGEAYEVLSDAKKRYRYDQGHDLMEVHQGGGGGYYADPYDANQLFNMFFQTGGLGGHSRGGGGRPYYSGSSRGAGNHYTHSSFR